MALSGVTLDLDSFNYSRSDAAASVITVHIAWTGAAGGETVATSLVRSDGYGVVPIVGGNPTFTATAGAGWHEITIALDTCLDTDGLYRAKSGWFVVSVTDGTTTWVSSPFTCTTISVNRLRNGILKGIPLVTTETVGALEQPVQTTGVVIDSVYPEHFPDSYTLAYTKTANTLSWAGGPPVNIADVRWNALVTLYAPSGDYIRVRVRPNLLPAASTSEPIAIDRKQMTDAEIVDLIWQAERFVETWTWIPPEPVTGATPLIQAEYPGAFYDRTLMPVHWQRPDNVFQFVGINTPYVWLQKLYELRGYFNTTSVVLVGPDWQDVTNRSGMITLVPRQGAAIQWQFAGGFFFNLLLAFQAVPNFWNYSIAFGVPNLGRDAPILLEAIEKKAIVEVLTRAGFINRPGYSAENIARDGVASSIAFSSGPGGIYSTIIAPYNDWLTTYVTGGRIRAKLVGLKAVVLS